MEIFSTVEEFEENLAKKGKQILIKHLGNQKINTLWKLPDQLPAVCRRRRLHQKSTTTTTTIKKEDGVVEVS